MNVIAQLEFELEDYDVAVQHISHNTTEQPPKKNAIPFQILRNSYWRQSSFAFWIHYIFCRLNYFFLSRQILVSILLALI